MYDYSEHAGLAYAVLVDQSFLTSRILHCVMYTRIEC
jgi:hypothetical protein